MSKLLLDDKPLIILPSLAAKIGLNESIVLQQLHYWLMESKNIKDGFKWVYNTYDDWQKQFPFWSVRTLKRIITGLETTGLIETGNYNKLKIDRTKWYRIDYEKLDLIVEQPEGQNGTSIVTKWHDGEANLSPPLPESSSESPSYIDDDEANPEILLKEKYMQLAMVRGFDISEKDKSSIRQVIDGGVPIKDALVYLEETFLEYEPKHARDKINSFSYCASCILGKHADKKEVQNGKKVPQHRGGAGGSAKKSKEPFNFFGDKVGRY